MFRFIALTMLVTATALASQIAYDGFDYSPGPLNLQNGGVGFSTPWFADPGVDVLPPGLSQPLALPSTGLEIGGDFNASRMLSNPLIQPIYWASFEISRTLGGNDQVFFGLDTTLTSTPFLSFGRQLDNYFVDVGGMPPIKCCIGSGPGVTDLLVARFVQTGPFTNMDLWINTNNFASPPNISTTFPTMAFAWVNMQVQPGLFADEVRLGTTAGDVAAAAIPEPGTFALIGFGLALFVMVRRVTRTTLRSYASFKMLSAGDGNNLFPYKEDTHVRCGGHQVCGMEVPSRRALSPPSAKRFSASGKAGRTGRQGGNRRMNVSVRRTTS